MTARRLCLLSPLVLPPLLGCELTEVTVPSGEPTVIVQSVLNTTRPIQFVIVERALTGVQVPGHSGVLLPPAEPGLPVSGATVTMMHLDPSTCPGTTVPLSPRSDTSGMYTTASLCPLRAGDRVRLRVETPDGRIVTGTTRVPGAEAVSVLVGGDSAEFEFQELELHRERDTLRIAVEPILARALQIEVRREDQQDVRPEDREDEIAVFFFTDTLGVALAGNLINPFAGDSGETVFRAGRAYLLSVSVTDSNYYDFIRSRSDPFTGRGFINHLEGGVGVFGSVETRTYVLRVVADVDDPREGVYRLQGRAGGADIDVTLELYLDDLQPGVFSAFVRGDWIGGEVRRSADGLFGDPDRAAGNDDAFTAEFRTRARLGVMAVFVMRGVRSARGTPFDVSLVGTDIQGEVILTATLTATQISGPTGR
ncbi:MAG: DUF4249 family protein [Gemmatimonadetes bacterium]|nr:DUF4249 family protein [Gemmatimonadota bacterium]